MSSVNYKKLNLDYIKHSLYHVHNKTHTHNERWKYNILKWYIFETRSTCDFYIVQSTDNSEFHSF